MTNKEKQLDKLVQIHSLTKRSIVSGARAECYHHIIGRRNLLLRYDIKNLAPMTLKEHELLHRGLLNPRYEHKEYLDRMKNVSFKDYLLENGLTKDEFLDIKLKEWRNYERFTINTNMGKKSDCLI